MRVGDGDLLVDAEDARITTTKEDGQVIQLSKSVQIVYKGQHLRAEEAKVKTLSKQVVASGHVVFTSADSTIEADRIELDYANNTGVIYNGYVLIGQVYFQGKMIRKTGVQTYETEDGTYTACTTCPAGWSFSGSRVTAEMGGYTYIKNSVMRIGGVPIFWLPYLVVPLKSERQSGFLFPTFEHSGEGGFAWSESFFWAMNQSTDSTWTLKSYDKRGQKGLLEYRYVLAPESRGQLNTAYMFDRKTDTNRWMGKYEHQYWLPEGFNHKASLNLASDLRYPRDFQSEMENINGLPAFENRMSVTKNSENTHSSMDTSYYVGLLKSKTDSDNLDAVHRFPEMRYSVVPTRAGAGGLLFSMDTQYNNFARDNFSYDDLNASKKVPKDQDGTPYSRDGKPYRDGTFNSSTDLIRTGQRFDLIPKLSYPVQVGDVLDIMPAISYRETQYQFGIADQIGAERRLLRAETSVRTRFSGVYGSESDDPHDTRYRHEFLPEITYSAIPWLYQQDHPFFGPREVEPNFSANTPINDNDTIQFDYNDRLVERNLVTLSMTNKLVRKRWERDAPQYKQVATFRLAQSYDFYEETRRTNESRQPYSDVTGLLDVRLDYFETNSLVRYFPYQNLTATSSRVMAKTDQGHYLQLNYSQDFLILKGTTVKPESRTEDLIVSAGIVSRLLNISGSTEYSFITYKIRSYSYDILIKPPGDCWSINFKHVKQTEGDTIIRMNFLFMFDGKTTSTIGSS